MGARILVVDNYDSFVFNLVQYLAQLGAECNVRAQRRGGAARDARRRRRRAARPGPGHPGEGRRLRRHGARTARGEVPVFGVCLGHQAIAVAYGGDRRPRPGAAARQDQRGAATRAPACWPGCRRRSPPPATTRSRSPEDTLPAELEVTGTDRQRRRDGAAAPRPAARGRAVPPRVGAHRGRAPAARQLAGDAAATRTPRPAPRGWRRWSPRRLSRDRRQAGGVDRAGRQRRGGRPTAWGSARLGGDRHREVTVEPSRRVSFAPGCLPDHRARLVVGRLLLAGSSTREAGLLDQVARRRPRPCRPRRAPRCCRWRT